MGERRLHVDVPSPLALAIAVTLLCSGAESAAEETPRQLSSRSIEDLDIAELLQIRVTPFDIAPAHDRGYRTSNSVSASRLSTPILDLPFAIQAFTEDFIADQQPVNLFDVARFSPGVTYRSNDGTEGNAHVAIRGFAVSSIPGNVQVLRDGFHGPSILDFTNISRVEVVKGPASFLYGQVAPGGIVNVITKSPKSELAATVSARYGSYDEHRFDVDVTGPATTTLFYRLAASSEQDLHYWKPYDARSWDIAPSLLWQPSDRVSLSVKYEHFGKRESPGVQQKPGYGRQAGVVPTPSDPNRQGEDVPGLPDDWNTASFADYRNSDTDNFTARLDVKANEHWNLRAGYAHLAYEVDMVFSGNGGMANNTTLLQGRRFRRQTYTNRDDTFELDAAGTYAFWGANLRLLVGAQWVDRRFDNWAAQAPNDPALGSDPIASPLPLWDLSDPNTWNRVVTIPLSALTANPTDRSTRYLDQSAYGGATLGLFSDRLLLLAGARYTATESVLTDRVLGGEPSRITASAVTPQLGALAHPLPGLSVFASYAESFVPGPQTLLDFDGTRKPAQPTLGWGYDVGVKADLLDSRLSGTLTVFEVRNRKIVNDVARTDASGSVIIFNVQSGEQRSRGVEFDVTATPLTGWQLYASYSFTDARILEVTGNDAAVLAQDPETLDAAGRLNYKNVSLLHNARLQMSAPHIANLWTRYDLGFDLLRGLYVGGGVNFIYDQTILPDGPAYTRQTYALVNALVGYTRGWRGVVLTLELSGKNLAGARYRPSQASRARPREFLLTLSAKF